MKIFIGLTEIANYYNNLVIGFEELGIDCTFLQANKHPFLYQSQSISFLESWLQWLSEKNKYLTSKQLLRKIIIKGSAQFIKIIFLLWAILNYDVFIFGFGTSFIINYYDLPILKLLRKKIIFVFHGSDSRPPYIDGSYIYINVLDFEEFSEQEIIKNTKKQKQKLKKIETYADIIINHTLTAHFQEKKFIPWFQIGIPYKPPIIIENQQSSQLSERIRIIHSPSHPQAKGTPLIRQAIKNLEDKQYKIDYIELIGKPNSVVLEELEKCDFVVDQLYSDTPLAGFATEAAYFAKPAIVGGYFTLEELGAEKEKIPPSHFCYPEQIEEAIEKLINDQNYRIELGKKAQKFLRNYWNYKKVAKRYLQIIQGDIPESWFYNPDDITYVYGGGVSASKAKQVIKSLLETEGKEILQLSDKPVLEQKFIEFAYSDD